MISQVVRNAASTLWREQSFEWTFDIYQFQRAFDLINEELQFERLAA